MPQRAATPLLGNNHPNAPLALRPPDHWAVWLPAHPLRAGAPRPRPAARAAGRRPAPLVTCQPHPRCALRLALPTEGAGSSELHRLGRGCSFQTSTVSLGHRPSCCGRESPHRWPGYNCRFLSGKIKVGCARLGAARRLTWLELEPVLSRPPARSGTGAPSRGSGERSGRSRSGQCPAGKGGLARGGLRPRAGWGRRDGRTLRCSGSSPRCPAAARGSGRGPRADVVLRVPPECPGDAGARRTCHIALVVASCPRLRCLGRKLAFILLGHGQCV